MSFSLLMGCYGGVNSFASQLALQLLDETAFRVVVRLALHFKNRSLHLIKYRFQDHQPVYFYFTVRLGI